MGRINHKSGLPTATSVTLVTLVALILGGVAAPAVAQPRGGQPGRGGGPGGGGGPSDWWARMREARERGGDRGRGDRGRSDRGRSDRGRSDRGRSDRGRSSSSSSSSSRGGQSSSGGDPYPLVAGFDGGGLLGFGIDPRSLAGRIVDLEARYDRRILERARSTMERYDKNHNGILEHSEWTGVSWQSDPRDSDLDHDGQLTLAEMAERLAKREAGSRSSGKSNSPSARPPERGDSSSRFGRRGGSDRGGDRGGDRGRGGSGGRGGFDPAMMLKRFDRNGDGTIHPDELDERTRRFAGGFLKRLGVDPDKPIRIDELAERIKKERAKRDSGGDAQKKKTVKVPERLAYKVEGSKQAEGRRSFRTKSPSLPEKMPKWWSDRDKNKDGQVALSEFLTTRSQRAAKTFRNYDLNNDGIVTVPEAKLVEEGY
jgi:hypothetical protein